MNVMVNTTPAGAEQPTTVYFYKHSMPPASLLPLTSVNENRSLDLLPLTSVNGKEAAPLTTGLQPHSMWLKPVTFMKSANRQLKQTAIKQTACPDFSGAIKQTLKKNPVINFSGEMTISNRVLINNSLRINPGSLSRIHGNLHVYSNMNVMGNTAGVAQPATVFFCKHTMPPASLFPPINRGRLLTLLPLTSVNENRSLDLLPLTLVNGKETAPLTTGLQPHSMWLKPVTLMKSSNRQLKQTAIKQTACPDFSGAIKQTAIKQTACPDFSGAIKQTAIKQTACPDFSGQQSREGRKCGSMRMKEKEQKGREQDAGFLSLDT